jgi:uncharacterized BrkB/YihY/UPF0761 family membrane protein
MLPREGARLPGGDQRSQQGHSSRLHGVIDQNLQSVLQQRGTIGIIGVVSLLWLASRMFTYGYDSE